MNAQAMRKEPQLDLVSTDTAVMQSAIPELKRSDLKSDEIKAFICIIPPKLAAFILKERNDKNRHLRATHAEGLAKSMDEGLWHFNGDTVRFTKDGNLADGQHRLEATVKSGIPLVALVVLGLSEEAFTTIDKGIKRSSADSLSLAGFHNATTLAAGMRLFMRWEKTGYPFAKAVGSYVTDESMLDTVRAYPFASECAVFVTRSQFCKKYLGPAVTTFCRLAFSTKDKTKAIAFFDSLEKRVGLTADSPIYHMQQKLLVERRAFTDVSKAYKTALLFEAFNAYVRDQGVDGLYLKGSGDRLDATHFAL